MGGSKLPYVNKLYSKLSVVNEKFFEIETRLTKIDGFGGKWTWLLPLNLIYIPFLVFPILIVFFLSFFSFTSFEDISFVGLSNYQTLISDGTFYTVLQNTFVYTIANSILTVGGGLFLALLIWGTYKRLRTVFQIAFLIPYAIMNVGVAIIWGLMYHPRQGALNALLEGIGSDFNPQWLGDSTFALPSVIAAGVWWTIGVYTIIWLVGLSSIDERYYEAAKMDGANRIQTFRHITLPMLKPIAVLLVIISLIFSLRTFGLIWVLTEGGPGHSTEVMVTWMYKIAFVQNNLGLASALGVILFLITLTVTGIASKVFGLSEDNH